MPRRSHDLRVAGHGSARRSLPIRHAMTMGADEGRVDVANSCFSKANVLKSQGKDAEALSLYTKSLDIWIEEYGPDHLSVAIAYNNIAAMYNLQGKHEEALALFKKCLDIDVKVLGPDDPYVAALYFNMARYRQSPVDPSFRALSGRLKFTVRRHKFNKDSLSLCQDLRGAEKVQGSAGAIQENPQHLHKGIRPSVYKRNENYNL